MRVEHYRVAAECGSWQSNQSLAQACSGACCLTPLGSKHYYNFAVAALFQLASCQVIFVVTVAGSGLSWSTLFVVVLASPRCPGGVITTPIMAEESRACRLAGLLQCFVLFSFLVAEGFAAISLSLEFLTIFVILVAGILTRQSR